MCFSSGKQKTYTPAAAPANPLPPPDEAPIGDTRSQENKQLHGQEDPSLQVRGRGQSGMIRMTRK